jgi:hypothetical protein
MLVWVVLYRQFLGLSKIGHSLAMVKKMTAKYTIKQVDRCLGNRRINLTVAQRDVIPLDEDKFHVNIL